MSNADIKKSIREAGLKQWEVAAKVGIADTTLCVWLRMPMSKEREKRVLKALQELKESKESEAADCE